MAGAPNLVGSSVKCFGVLLCSQVRRYGGPVTHTQKAELWLVWIWTCRRGNSRFGLVSGANVPSLSPAQIWSEETPDSPLPTNHAPHIQSLECVHTRTSPREEVCSS